MAPSVVRRGFAATRTSRGEREAVHPPSAGYFALLHLPLRADAAAPGGPDGAVLLKSQTRPAAQDAFMRPITPSPHASPSLAPLAWSEGAGSVAVVGVVGAGAVVVVVVSVVGVAGAAGGFEPQAINEAASVNDAMKEAR
jgi:hypothetical protein